MRRKRHSWKRFGSSEDHTAMKTVLQHFLNAALVGAVLITPVVAPTALRADDHKYHDAKHNDDHEWNSHEDKAYRMYVKENHGKYRDFGKLKEEERQSYWDWRHEHSDAVLKINIR
jgi:hypothetical protein